MTAQVLSSGRRFTVAGVAMDAGTSNAEAVRALLAAAKKRGDYKLNTPNFFGQIENVGN